MTFRDDHDAAIARSDALQRELDSTKEKAADTEAELEAANTARDKLAVEVERLRAQVPAPVSAPSDERKGSPTGIFVVIGVVALLILLGLVVYGVARSKSAKPDPRCTLVTEPPGATIVARRVATDLELPSVERGGAKPPRTRFDMVLGTTPLSQRRSEWIMESVIGDPVFEARLPGYKTINVMLPTTGDPCSNTYRFVKEPPPIDEPVNP